MALRRPKSRAGITLIEAMAAIVIVTIAVIGASGYRYYSTLDAKKAAMHSTAARIGLLLCENWRGRGFDRTTTYEPVAHLGTDLDITTSSFGPSTPKGFTLLGQYEINVNDTKYLATLSWKDDAAAPGLRALNVVVAWAQRQTGSDDTGVVVMDKEFKLTTYVLD